MEAWLIRGRLPVLAVAAMVLGVTARHDGTCAAADVASLSIVTAGTQPMMANLGDEYRCIRLSPDRDAFEQVTAALAERGDLDFHDTPLREAVDSIAASAGIGIGFDHRSLEDSGVDIDDATVTGNFKDVSLHAVLRELLGGLDLDLVFRNERLVVTTVDTAGQHLVRFFYPMIGGTDADELVALVERTVAPDSWDTVGGTGAIVPAPPQMGPGLVITQTEAVHGDIAALLRGLDTALWTPDQVDDDVEPRFIRIYPVADPLVRESAVERLADICNEGLPHGSDPEATIEAVGESLVIRSKSRAFQVMAAQVLASLQGMETILMEEIDEEGEDDSDPAPADAHATHLQKTALTPSDRHLRRADGGRRF